MKCAMSAAPKIGVRGGHRLAAVVGVEDRVLGEQLLEGLQVALLGGREEPLQQGVARGFVGVEPRPARLEVLARPRHELPRVRLGPLDDRGDVRVLVPEGVAQQVGRSLDGGEPLHEHQQGERERLRELGARVRPGHRVPEERLGQPRPDIRLAARPRRREDVDRQAGRHRGHPRGRLVDRVLLAREAQERLLRDVLGLRDAAEHPVCDAEAVPPQCLELGRAGHAAIASTVGSTAPVAKSRWRIRGSASVPAAIAMNAAIRSSSSSPETKAAACAVPGGPRLARREDRAEGRDARRDPDLPERAVDAGGHARDLRPDDADRRRCQRRVHKAGAEAGDDEAGNQVRPLRRRIDAAHEQQARSDQQEPGADEQPDGDVRREPACRDRREQGRAGHHQQPQAGLQRREVQDVLEVDDEEQEHGEQRSVHPERRDQTADERRLAEQGEVEHRLAHHPLDEREGCQQDEGDGEAADHHPLVQPCSLARIRP